jgi:hypothetical protein
MRLVDGSLEKLLAHARLDKFEVLDCLRGLLHRGSWKTAGVMSAAIGERSGLRHALSFRRLPLQVQQARERKGVNRFIFRENTSRNLSCMLKALFSENDMKTLEHLVQAKRWLQHASIVPRPSLRPSLPARDASYAATPA